ncbi:MAG: winged helix-turn-helix transcriptional regulator [Dehalococcoidia bacterium]|jgi:DNA-binding transcriptional ArsR family regulator|nr:winged helix-turn-helix transcriptional regulator [Dehalococcoidia bacterium]
MSTFAALAEPNRRLLLDALRDGARTVNMLVEAIGLSQPAVSKHLRILREAGLVVVRPEGQRRWYEVDAAPLADLDAWLEPYRAHWATRLDALERHLDNTAERSRTAAQEKEPNA